MRTKTRRSATTTEEQPRHQFVYIIAFSLLYTIYIIYTSRRRFLYLRTFLAGPLLVVRRGGKTCNADCFTFFFFNYYAILCAGTEIHRSIKQSYMCTVHRCSVVQHTNTICRSETGVRHITPPPTSESRRFRRSVQSGPC